MTTYNPFTKSRKQVPSARTKQRVRYNRRHKRRAKATAQRMFSKYLGAEGLWHYVFHTRERMFITKHGAPTTRTVRWDGRFRFADGTMLRP